MRAGVGCTGYGWLTGVTVPMAQTRAKRRAMAEQSELEREKRPGGQNDDDKASPTRQVAESRRGAKVVRGGGVGGGGGGGSCWWWCGDDVACRRERERDGVESTSLVRDVLRLPCGLLPERASRKTGGWVRFGVDGKEEMTGLRNLWRWKWERNLS